VTLRTGGFPFRPQELTEFVHGETYIPGNPAHRDRVDWVVPRNHDFAVAIRHDDMLSLAKDVKTDLLQGTHGIEVVHARQPRHD
jgi:hypothetical protein